jgi:hypothetical protein
LLQPVAIALALVTLLSAAPPSPTPIPEGTAGAGVGIQLLDIPVESQDDSRARANIVDNLTPGTTIQRRVTISNFDDVSRDAQVYAAASTIVDGKFSPDDGNPTELTTWISVDQPTVSLPAHHSTEVTVTIAVPEDAAESEQYATIWAQVNSATTGDVNTASRTGIRVYLSVGPGNGPPADFSIQELTTSRTADGTPQVHALVENTGGRAVDISGTVSLTGGPGETSAGPFTTSLATTILPGKTGTVTVPLAHGLIAGPWDAAVTLTSGVLVKETTATITFPESGETSVVETAGFPGWAVILIAVLALLIIAAVIVILRRRTRGATRVTVPSE